MISGDSVDGHSEEEGVDPYDELGRTPPRQIMARNRKWSAAKKHGKEMEKRFVNLGVIKLFS